MKKIITFFLAMIGLNTVTSCSGQEFNNSDVQEFDSLVRNKNTQVLDVRTSEEYAEGHIANALNIDVNSTDFMKQALTKLDNKKHIAVYCRSGRRSANAAKQLAAKGFKVTNLAGGIIAWAQAKKPVVTEKKEPQTATH